MAPRKRVPDPRGRPERPFPGLGRPLFEAGAVLDELPGPGGLLLWRLLVDVALWGQTPAPERPGLFHPDSPARGLPPLFGLEEPVREVVERLWSAEPGGEAAVGEGCARISAWAEGRRLPRTALLFAQAAATAAPRVAGHARRVGVLARGQAEHARAEVWFRRAVTLARAGGDRHTYASSLAGLGLLFRQRGNYPAATRFMVRSLRAARKYKLRGMQCDALHYLCALAVEQGHRADVVEYGQRAVQLCGPGHPHLPALASNVAWFWMEHEGAFARALKVFRGVLRHVDESARLLVLANIARAAGGSGERELFRWARDAVWNGLAHVPGNESHALALLDVAQGALSLGLREDARVAAEGALATAQRRSEAKAVLAAEALLNAVENDLLPVTHRGSPSPPPDANTTEEEDRLADSLVIALARTPG